MSSQLNLEYDEHVVYTLDSGVFEGAPKLNATLSTFSLTLTDKNIIMVEKGMFGKVRAVEKQPLREISMYNGRPQVMLDKTYGVVTVYFKSGEEKYNFTLKKDAKEFINALNSLLSTDDAPESDSYINALPGAAAVAATLADTANVFSEAFGLDKKFGKKKPKKTAVKCPGCGAQIVGREGESRYCDYCDTFVSL